jgi:hypothetical protein
MVNENDKKFTVCLIFNDYKLVLYLIPFNLSHVNLVLMHSNALYIESKTFSMNV